MMQSPDLTDAELRAIAPDLTPAERAALTPAEQVRLQAIEAQNRPPSLGGMLKDAAVGAGKYAVNHPMETGAAIGGIAGAPMTGGTSLLPSLAATGLGGMAGAGLGMTADAIRQYFGGDPSGDQLPSTPSGVAKHMIDQGGIQMAGELGGRAISSTLKGGANLLMNETVPSEIAKDFSGVNIGDVLNRHAINPTTEGGAAKARLLRRGAGRQTQSLVDTATANGVPGITRKDVTPYLGQAHTKAAEDASAGIDGGDQAIADRVDALFRDQPYEAAPNASLHKALPLNQAPGATRSLQAEGKIVRKQVSADKPPTDLGGITADNLAAGVRRTTGDRVPGYADANKTTQELVAAAQAASKMSKMPVRIGGWPSRIASGTLASGGLAGGDPLAGFAAATVPLALGTPQISAPMAISLYKAGKLPYALLLKVVGPDMLAAAGVTGP